MRSRSSRLFIVLIHLVGVSTNLPRNPFLAALFPNGQTGMGIVGVHPLAILLEPLELRVAGGLDKMLNILEDSGYNVEENMLSEPYWLQDDTDGQCLGPAGFSECGDATLWTIRRRPVYDESHGMDREHNPFYGLSSFISGVNSEEKTIERWDYALELYDANTIHSSSNEEGGKEACNRKRRGRRWGKNKSDCVEENPECMMPSFPKDSSIVDIGVGPCTSKEAWSWEIDENGVLLWDKFRGSKKHTQDPGIGGIFAKFMQGHNDDLDETKISSNCLCRANSTMAIIDKCDSNTVESDEDEQPVSFSVIQYQSKSPVTIPKLPLITAAIEEDGISLDLSDYSTVVKGAEEEEEVVLEQSDLPLPLKDDVEDHANLPRQKRPGHDHASMKVIHPELLSTASLLHANLAPPSNTEAQRNKKIQINSSPLGVGGYSVEKPARSSRTRSANSNLIHTSTNKASPSQDQNPPKPRKIPVHPLIAASKNGIYEDPETGLSYHTDLSKYLGHDRKQTGRHTLMGVGTYVRTMLKIKVYGVAFYVPKRDVLADAQFKEFAAMNVEQLQASDEFYDHLLGVGSDPLNGPFDKTLFIKLNMQLSVDTMRASLEADWKLLSPDHKTQLINSSFEKRPADEHMLEVIESNENSSRCSCGQIAPESYESDPTCCARGTELVFTWRKNGDLELRVDGRLIDVFPSPDMARGIFFEYLRGDDAISPEARNNFSDGFPFLLAPLAQVKGVSSLGHTEEPVQRTRPRPSGLGLFTQQATDFVTSRSNMAVEWVQGNVQGGITNVSNARKAIVTSSVNFGAAIESRGQGMLGNVMSFKDQSVKLIWHKFILGNLDEIESATTLQNSLLDNDHSHNESMTGMMTNGSYALSDEIGVIAEPTQNFTHLLFLYMVHFYLVLLLIVSVPGSYSIRLVVSKRSLNVSKNEMKKNDERERLWERANGEDTEDIQWSGTIQHDTIYTVKSLALKGIEIEKTVQNDSGTKFRRREPSMKKSLSYYL